MITRDLLMCVGVQDIDRLFLHSLVSCCRCLDSIRAIHIVTPSPPAVREKLKQAGAAPLPVQIWGDADVLDRSTEDLPGWSRQQAVKLSADRICDTQQILCIGADTVLLQPVGEEHLCRDGVPILYSGGTSAGDVHYEYEWRRLHNLAAMLEVMPDVTARHVDFIMDFFVFDASILRALRAYLDDRFGRPGLDKVLPRRCDSLEERVVFGEWTLYALFALDVLRLPLPLCASDRSHLVQVHSDKDLKRFTFESRIVHFVSKEFDLGLLGRQLAAHGVTDRFR